MAAALLGYLNQCLVCLPPWWAWQDWYIMIVSLSRHWICKLCCGRTPKKVVQNTWTWTTVSVARSLEDTEASYAPNLPRHIQISHPISDKIVPVIVPCYIRVSHTISVKILQTFLNMFYGLSRTDCKLPVQSWTNQRIWWSRYKHFQLLNLKGTEEDQMVHGCMTLEFGPEQFRWFINMLGEAFSVFWKTIFSPWDADGW